MISKIRVVAFSSYDVSVDGSISGLLHISLMLSLWCLTYIVHFFQGFHDIVVTFLLVVEEDVTFALMDKLSRNHLK